MSRYVAPTLTTIRLPAIEQGRYGGEMLINLIESKPVAEQRIFLPTELIVRESCGACRAI
jgi:LacI family transcriptional regulator